MPRLLVRSNTGRRRVVLAKMLRPENAFHFVVSRRYNPLAMMARRRSRGSRGFRSHNITNYRKVSSADFRFLRFLLKIPTKRLGHKTAAGAFGRHYNILSLGKPRGDSEDSFWQCSGTEFERKDGKGWRLGVSGVAIRLRWVYRLFAACRSQMRQWRPPKIKTSRDMMSQLWASGSACLLL